MVFKCLMSFLLQGLQHGLLPASGVLAVKNQHEIKMAKISTNGTSDNRPPRLCVSDVPAPRPPNPTDTAPLPPYDMFGYCLMSNRSFAARLVHNIGSGELRRNS